MGVLFNIDGVYVFKVFKDEIWLFLFVVNEVCLLVRYMYVENLKIS